MTAEERPGHSDVDIIVGLQMDPREGLRLLIDTYGGQVRGWVKKKFRSLDHHHLEAALNTAHYQLWKFAPQYDESKGTLGACYLTFARNAAASILRGEYKHYRKRTDFDAILEGDVPGKEHCDEPPARAPSGRSSSPISKQPLNRCRRSSGKSWRRTWRRTARRMDNGSPTSSASRSTRFTSTAIVPTRTCGRR